MTKKYIWTPEKVHNYYNNLKQGDSLILPKDAYCTKNFTWNELLKTNNRFFKTAPAEEILNNLKSVADILQTYREKFALPVIITSSWRTPEEQKYLLIKGRKPSSTSLHLEGLALDFVIPNKNLKEVHQYLDTVHFGEVEFGSDYTHISLPTFSKRYLKNKGLDINKFYRRTNFQGLSVTEYERNMIIKRFYENNIGKLVTSHFNPKENLNLFKDKSTFCKST